MELKEKVDLVMALFLAAKQTRDGVASYRNIRTRIINNDFDTEDPEEVAAVKVFYQEIEKENLGAQMDNLATELNALYRQLSAVCREGNEETQDFEFSEIAMQFLNLLEQWQPLSDACEQIGKKMNKYKTRRK